MEKTIGMLMQTVKLLLLNRTTPTDLAMNGIVDPDLRERVATVQEITDAVDADGKNFDMHKLTAVLLKHQRRLRNDIVLQ